MDNQRIKYIVESVLLAAGKPLGLDQLLAVFGDGERPERDDIREAVTALQQDYAERGIELVEVASGYRIQVSQSMEPWVSRLTEEKPARYSRALLETLALVAYRQPITRGEIEDIRGVSVSSSIMKTLQEREWVRVVGHRDVPGRPAMYGTTRQFLDYFNLNGLDDLPTLMELRDIDTINAELDLELPGQGHGHGDDEAAGDMADTASPAAVQVPVDVGDSNGTLH
ncbi:MAG: SMC-Scp complex subunit ScpB [Thiogranum sp.]|jgi:segregation and condensation protein B